MPTPSTSIEVPVTISIFEAAWRLYLLGWGLFRRLALGLGLFLFGPAFSFATLKIVGEYWSRLDRLGLRLGSYIVLRRAAAPDQR